ncbi:MAG: XRE family transcriptional regulator [Bacteriovorax sp.]
MKKYNPYDIDVDSIKASKKITDERELLKYRLSAEINKILQKLTTEEAVAKTGLNRADLSRIKIQRLYRFTIDRLIKVLHLLDQSVNITVRPKKIAS